MNNQGTIQIFDRDIYLYGDIDDSMALEVVTRINHINEVDSMEEQALIDDIESKILEGILDENALRGVRAREPINIEINSNGGSSPAGFSIITAIQNSETPTIGYVTGNCMSMAIPILASCDFKIGSQYSKFMIHDVYSASEGKFNDLKSSFEYVSSVREDYIRATAKNTKMTEEDVREITNRNSDYFFSPEKAFDLGLIDLIDDSKVDEEDMLNKLYGLNDDAGSAVEEDSEECIDSNDNPFVKKASKEELKEVESSLGFVAGEKNENIYITEEEIEEHELYTDTDNSISITGKDEKGLLSRITDAISYIIKG